jgi:DNA polymerase elongation subunit (family B)
MEEDTIIFQALEFNGKDHSVEITDDKGRTYRENTGYVVQIFGMTSAGKTVCANISGFNPYFFVGIPEDSEPHFISELKEAILNKFPKKKQQEQIRFDEETSKVLYDFNNHQKIPVLKLSTPNKSLFTKLKNIFLDKDSNFLENPVDPKMPPLKVYEANIDPMLRFFHATDISPSGWIAVSDFEPNDEGTEKADINIKATVGDIEPKTILEAAPFKVISWDIECMSSHGDFPVPKKNYRKVAREIIEGKWLDPAVEILQELPLALEGKSTKHLSFIELKPQMKKAAPSGIKAFEKRLPEIIRAIKDKESKNEKKIDTVTAILDKTLPAIQGDRAIQIGMVMWIAGKPVEKWIYTLGSCDPVKHGEDEDTSVPIHTHAFPNQNDEGEQAMFSAWIQELGNLNPDILIGYNIFGFDEKYCWERFEELGLIDYEKKQERKTDKNGILSVEEIIVKYIKPNLAVHLSRLKEQRVGLKEQRLSSGAMGDNFFYILEMHGRLQIDLLPYIRRNFNLQSYSLDSVSSHFMAGGLKSIKETENKEILKITTKSTKGLRVGRYVVVLDAENDKLSKKMEVIAMTATDITVRSTQPLAEILENGRPEFWCMVKDDVSPQDIFRLQKGTSADRSIVAKYCLQDCDLVMDLFNKLEAFRNAQAMADVCCVPTGYIYMRGQGIKIESLIFKECMKEGQLIEVLPSQGFPDAEDLLGKDDGDSEEEEEEEEDSYEGAIVLKPKAGIYLDDPIATLDFASLYPSTIISENLSHDTLIWVKDYDDEGNVTIKEGSDTYDNLPGYKYVNVEYDILRADPADKRKNPTKIKAGTRISRYVQFAGSEKGTIPKILQKLLKARKTTRKLIETETDDFKKGLLDCQQNAYKITANSLYGQLGSKTFKIRRVCLAASTTAYGRKQLMYAKAVVEDCYSGKNDKRCDATYVYGDTDSVFINFRVRDPVTGKPIKGKEALPLVKALAIEAGKLCTSSLKAPHDFEYDKIMWPFCLLSKKRYVGNKYEDDLDNPSMTSMGIVMKRRDNAPIVKVIYGGIIDRILHKHDVVGAFEFTKILAKELIAGKFGLHKLTITKSLRAEYANPERIAHKVLADRITARDPGNAPSSSQRIGYVYIATPKGQPEPTLQGEKIETPAFITANKLTPDYAYYIERQIAKPVAQVFALVLESLPGFKKSMIPSNLTEDKLVKKRQKIAEQLLFGEILSSWKNKQCGQKEIREMLFPKAK